MRYALLPLIAATALLVPGVAAAATTTSGGWNVETQPIDPAQLSDLPFGTRSFSAQPWRAYQETVPTQTLRDAVGVNFNVSPTQAAATARALKASGFTRARVEIGWDAMSYDDPTQLADPMKWGMILSALRDNGIRPLILLNANEQAPGPTKSWTAQLTQPVHPGATTVQLDAASAAQVVPGRSGINGPGGAAAQVVFTAVDDAGRATLSQPIPFELPAGAYAAATRRFAPFGRPFAADGSPNASFQATLHGWLQYVSTVTRSTAGLLGSDAFDVEVWNELGFGSGFLDAGNYYAPLPAEYAGTGSVQDEVLTATAGWLRDPANGVSHVGIGDGFANQTPFTSPADLPAGVTALDKHPYHGFTAFGRPLTAPNQPVDSRFKAAGTLVGDDWSDDFVPTFNAFFPEFALSGIQSETIVRDMAPVTTTYDGHPHGRFARPGTTTQTWLTETNLERPAGISATDADHLQAKVALRTLAAYVDKGASVVDFYAAGGSSWGLIPQTFFDQIDAGGDPDAAQAGPTLAAVGRFVSAMGAPAAITSPRSLGLTAIADQHDHQQWAGDGSAAHPALKNRDVLAVLPFQTTNNSFAVPVYVMTQDLSKVYNARAAATDATRTDLPDETYRVSLTGVRKGVSASLYDPLTQKSLPVTVTATGTGKIDVTLPVTDYPRVLRLTDK